MPVPTLQSNEDSHHTTSIFRSTTTNHHHRISETAEFGARSYTPRFPSSAVVIIEKTLKAASTWKSKEKKRRTGFVLSNAGGLLLLRFFNSMH